MAKLFDKYISTSTSFDSEGITDSSASWKANKYKGWFISIDGSEYEITSNTATKLIFSNSLTDNNSYIISFVGRDYLTELESELSDTTRVPDSLIAKKYNQANADIHNKIYSSLKLLLTDSFDPIDNILNLDVMRQVFAYYILSKVYQDLMIDNNSFEGFKGVNMYEKSFEDNIKDAMSLIILDKEQDGVEDVTEIRATHPSFTYLSR